jgi:CheY-like chemotaxis protein
MLQVLIVDDNDSNLFTLKYILEQVEGINVSMSHNGREALSFMAKNPIHLILVDIQMPEMNGFEFCNQLRADKNFKDIPFIFLTAYFKSEEFEERGYQLGAFDYLTKPIDEARLLTKIRLYKLLHQKQEELKQANRELSRVNHELKEANYKLKKMV